MDFLSTKTRSRVMSAIRVSGNKSTERRLKSYLCRSGISGWKIGGKPIKGKPDIVFPKLNIALFVDGCFWHGCKRCGRPPHSNLKYWTPKLKKNAERDLKVSRYLRRQGWRVIRIWEHELDQMPLKKIDKIRQILIGEKKR